MNNQVCVPITNCIGEFKCTHGHCSASHCPTFMLWDKDILERIHDFLLDIVLISVSVSEENAALK